MSEHLTNIVVVAVIHKGNKIFVARRAATKKVWPDRFELIGGHVDPGEDLETALHREVKEEVRADIVIGSIVDAFTYSSEDIFKVEIGYLCKLKDYDAEPVVNPNDHSEGRWIDSSEISVMGRDDDEVQLLKKALMIIERQGE